MSYNIQIWGHKDFPEGEDTPEAREQFDLDLIERVQAFGASLPAMTGGAIVTTTQGQTSLPASDGADTNPDHSPVQTDDGDDTDDGKKASTSSSSGSTKK